MSGYELYQIARKHLGEGGAKARAYCGLPSGAAWCNAYVCYVANEGGVKNLYFGGTKQTYCPTSIKWCRTNLAEVPLYLAMPMDIIYFDWQPNGNPDHIGFVKARKDTSSIDTHEGNTSGGKVDEKTRTSKYVLGIFRPHLKPTALPTGKECVVDGEFGYDSIYFLQKALGITADGILGKDTVKALQKKAGCDADGAWGKGTSKAVQKMVGATVDGEFGKDSVKALQKWCNTQNGESEDSSATVSKTETVAKSAYTGTFPDLVLHSRQMIGRTAKNLAYPKGTKKKTYTYGKGKARPTFTAAINKVFPKRSSWSKQCQAGASCDVGAGTIIRYSGYDTSFPRGLGDEQIPHLKKSALWDRTNLTKGSQMQYGDVGVYSGHGGHIWISLGGKLLAEANHTAKYFEHIVYKNIGKGNHTFYAIYRACKPMAMKNGSEGTEVTKLQNFLNWAGFSCGTADGGFGTNTEKAVKAFQTAAGVTADGEVGSTTLAKMKEWKK